MNFMQNHSQNQVTGLTHVTDLGFVHCVGLVHFTHSFKRSAYLPESI